MNNGARCFANGLKILIIVNVPSCFARIIAYKIMKGDIYYGKETFTQKKKNLILRK